MLAANGVLGVNRERSAIAYIWLDLLRQRCGGVHCCFKIRQRIRNLRRREAQRRVPSGKVGLRMCCSFELSVSENQEQHLAKGAVPGAAAYMMAVPRVQLSSGIFELPEG